jgi:hypothetical protein
MSTYSTISIDQATKQKASKKAKKDLMPLSAVVRILLNDYVDGKITIGSQVPVTENGFTPAFEAAILATEQEESSPAFETADEAIAFLEEETKKMLA